MNQSELNASEVRRLREENVRLRARLFVLGRVIGQITASLDLPTVLQRVVEGACELTGARYGALVVFDKAGGVQDFFTHGVTQEERERIGAPPQGKGVLGFLHEVRRPVRLANVRRHPRSVGFPPHHPRMTSFLGMPILSGEEDLGTIYLTNKAGERGFTPDDEEMLVPFAAEAAVAIRNARAHQQVVVDRRSLEALVDTSPAGVVVAEAGTGRVLLVNREAERLLDLQGQPGDTLQRYERAVIYRRPDGRAYAPDELPLRRALAKGERVLAEEMRFDLPDGRSVPVLVTATPIRSPEGSITSAVAIIQDTSPLEEVERLRSEFLGMVSHELKTPLTAIKGSAATALGSRRALNAAETAELFHIIDEQADRLRDLVNNLLDMTRIEAGTLSVSAEPTDLRQVLEEAVAGFSRGPTAHEVRLEVADALPVVQADPQRLSQVLANLLSNAAKFSPETSPITVRAEGSEQSVAVSVRDEGRGIPTDKVPYLFKKFSQVHEKDQLHLAGTGLGLAICKGLVEAHGGRIWAESAGPGKGATFTFTLPVGAPAAPEPSLAGDVTRRSEQLGRVTRPSQRTRILAVDDDLQVLHYLQRSLGAEGFQVVVANDPAEAPAVIEREEPDLVLLDMVFPGTNGLEVLKRIREFSGVPVIFLTARDDSADMVRALKTGADDYVTKPFAAAELIARIEATLRRRVLPDTLETRAPFRVGHLTVNFTERRVTMGGTALSLSATEYKLLYELAVHAGRVLTHDQILQRVWGPEYQGETELVRSFIRNLRRKLNDAAASPRYILTEPRVGYRLAKE